MTINACLFMDISYQHRPWKTLRIKQGWPMAFLFTQRQPKAAALIICFPEFLRLGCKETKDIYDWSLPLCPSVLHPPLHQVHFFTFSHDWLTTCYSGPGFPSGWQTSISCVHSLAALKQVTWDWASLKPAMYLIHWKLWGQVCMTGCLQKSQTWGTAEHQF